MYHYKLNYKLNVTTIFAFCAQKLQNENLEKLVIESKQEVLLLELYIASIVCVCVCGWGVLVYVCVCVCVLYLFGISQICMVDSPPPPPTRLSPFMRRGCWRRSVWPASNCCCCWCWDVGGLLLLSMTGVCGESSGRLPTKLLSNQHFLWIAGGRIC